MFFSKAARVLAILGFIAATTRIASGVYLALSGVRGAELGSYTSLPTTGAMIDQGTLWLVVTVALGTLAEIAFAVRTSGGQLKTAGASPSRD